MAPTTVSRLDLDSLREHLVALMAANDLRYEQRALAVRDSMDAASLLSIERERVAEGRLEGLFEKTKAVRIEVQASNDQRFLYLDKQIVVATENLDRRIMASMESSEKATHKAEMAMEKRFDGVNEFRSTLADQQATLMPRQEVAVTMGAMSARIEEQNKAIKDQNERIVALAATKTGTKEGWGLAVGVFGMVMLVIAIVTFVINRIVPAPVYQSPPTASTQVH